MMSAASAAREHAPPDEGGLRTALRNVPMLPAPANVDDLLARLDADEMPLSSGPLAALVSDARYVEPEPLELGENGDDFFAPVSRAANANLARPSRPLASRLLGGLFTAGLLSGAVLICWNALLAPDAALPPPALPAIERSELAAPAIALPSDPDRLSGAGELVAETWHEAGTIQPAETPAAAAEATVQPDPTLASPEPIALPELEPAPQLEFVAVVPDPVVISEVAQSLAIPPSSEARLESEPRPQAETAAAAEALSQADAVQSREILAALNPVEPTEAVSLRDLGPVKPEPTREAAQALSHETLASMEPVRSPGPEQPRPEAVAGTPGPVVEASRKVDAPAPRPASPSAARTVASPAPPVRAKAPARAPFAGVWAESPEACTPAMQREGSLLAYISARRGRAGDTTCSFRKIRRTGNTWNIAAVCSDAETTWKSDVQLSLTRGRLTWTSQKGSQSYVRCPRA
jgi:hypothetical protein